MSAVLSTRLVLKLVQAVLGRRMAETCEIQGMAGGFIAIDQRQTLSANILCTEQCDAEVNAD